MSDKAAWIPLFIAVPLAGAFLNSLVGRRVRALPDFLGGLVTLVLLGLSLLALQRVRADSIGVYQVGGWELPVGITMVLDGLTAFMLVTVNAVACAIAVYARDYMERYTSKDLFYTLFLLLLTGMNGVLVAGDLFNLFVFLEIAAVASYALVAFGTERNELEAAFKYGVMGSLASLFILLGIALLYGMASTLNLADMSQALKGYGDSDLLLMVSALLLMGLGLKAALVPFHAWLPDAHPSAPAPISAILSALLIKCLGVYALCRIFFNVIGISPRVLTLLMYWGALSMMVGVILAMGQRDLKRLLAYSTISQVGYVVLGLGLGTPLGILGAMLHLFNHSISKALLFLASGALEYATGTRDLYDMGGLRNRMPITHKASFAAAMSIAGMPPFAGFWSKLIIIMAAVEAGRLGFAVWAVIVSVLTLALFAGVMKKIFWGESRPQQHDVREVTGCMQASMLVLALFSLLSGALLIPGIREKFILQASEALTLGTNYAQMIMSHL